MDAERFPKEMTKELAEHMRFLVECVEDLDKHFKFVLECRSPWSTAHGRYIGLSYHKATATWRWW